MNAVKNVLITGAAQGIGAGIAWAFGRKGYRVIAADLEGFTITRYGPGACSGRF